MIDLLAELFNKASLKDIDKICYFLLGEVAAEYKHIKLGIGDKMAIEAIALAGDLNKEEVEAKFKELGDLGNVASELLGEKHTKFQEFFEFEKNIMVSDIHKGFMKIAEASGSGSVEEKEKIIAAILAATTSIERKYLMRMILGDMRLGLGDMTILDGLATAFLGTKDKRPELERAYNVCSDIGHVAEIIFSSGLEGVKKIRMALNRPIKPMLAQRVSEMKDILEKIDSKEISVEEKYDGERIQVHKDGKNFRLFSRRLTEVTDQFPDIIENIIKFIKFEQVILDGEAVAYDFENQEYESFQKLMQRRRKYDIAEYAEKIPVKYMFFDLLYLDGESYLDKSYPDRRKKLEKVSKENDFIVATNRKLCKNLDEIDEYFQETINLGLEGVLCKSCSPDSHYRAGAREWLWIKWKTEYASHLSDTLDLVVVGAYAGKGKRSGTYGALLCAAYNHEKDFFQTITKLGTGFSDEELENLPKKLADAKSGEQPIRLQINKDVKPDFWFIPKYVVEVNGAEITESPIHTTNWDKEKEKGLALRFPRFERWRLDKKAEDATTVDEIIKMTKK
jgi:DNA ligase-1